MRCLLTLLVILFLLACSEKNDKGLNASREGFAVSNERLQQNQFLLYNFRNDLTTLNGRVKLCYQYFDFGDKEKFNTSNYKVHPYKNIISYRNHREYDSIGHAMWWSKNLTKFYPFFTGSRNFNYHRDSTLLFDRLDSEYSMHVKYPNIVEFNHKYTNARHLKAEEPYMIDNQYKYFFDSSQKLYKKNHYQLYNLKKKNIARDTIIDIETTFRYEDHKINKRLTRFRPNQPKDDMFLTDNGLQWLHDKLVPINIPCEEDFEYDGKGRVIKWHFYQGKTNYLTHYYVYNDKDILTKKTVIDYQILKDYNRLSYQADILFDDYENITRVDRININGDTLNTQYYEYFKFDTHDNWTELKAYLDGDKDDKGPVSLSARRELTYHE